MTQTATQDSLRSVASNGATVLIRRLYSDHDDEADELRIRLHRSTHPNRSVRDSLLPLDRRRHDIRRRYHEIVGWGVGATGADRWLMGEATQAFYGRTLPEAIPAGIDIWEGPWWSPDSRPPGGIPAEHADDLGPKAEHHVRAKEHELAGYVLGEHRAAYRLAGTDTGLTELQQTQLRVLARRAGLILAQADIVHPYDVHDLSLWGFGAELTDFAFSSSRSWQGTTTARKSLYNAATRTYRVAIPDRNANRLQAVYARVKPSRLDGVADVVTATTVSETGLRRDFSDSETGFDVPLSQLARVEVKSVSEMREELLYTVVPVTP